MAFTVGAIAAKDGGAAILTGGLLAADTVGGGAGPWFLYYGLVDGVAGVNKAAITAANALKVDGSAVTQPVSQATAASLNATVVGTGTFAVQAAAILNAETTKVIGVTRGADGSGNLLTSTTNALDVNLKSGALAVGSNVIGKVGIDQTTDLTTNKVRAFIHDGTTALPILAASSGAPAATVPAIPVSLRDVNPNGQALMAASAPVTLPSDSNGPYSGTANFVSGAITTAMTGTTSTSLVAAPGASLRNYITTIIVSNAQATVGTDVIIQDGSGGTTLLTIPAAALYGGGVISLPVPLKQPTTNTALFCANVTTGASTKVSAVGYKGA